jgi:5-oxoprolinase (ATP-hydrolysing)
MNSVGFFGGRNAKPGEGYSFAYGETICGGAGAGPTWDGASAVHCHMTNTRISDIEILEKRYPIIVREFSLHQGSGGVGLHPGGLGVTRIIECREPLTFSMISERRVTTPYGLKGGEDGASGQNLIRKIDPVTGDSRIVSLGPRGLVKLGKGDQFIIKSPGGGGWGKVVEVNGNENGNIEDLHSEKVLTNGA